MGRTKARNKLNGPKDERQKESAVEHAGKT